MLQQLIDSFEAHSSPEDARPMSKYLRDQFEFLGIKTPLRRSLVRELVATHREEVIKDLQGLTSELWHLRQREYQHTAVELMERFVGTLSVEDLPLLESLIIQRSWWDTVDALATRVVGPVVMTDRSLAGLTLSAWRASDNLWLRRTVILFQLKYKEDTDEELLFEIVGENAGSREFFVQKAIGWALREYSKTRPAVVDSFVRSARLPPLSTREALKWLRTHPA